MLLGLLAYLAFAGLALFTVRDVDFFSAASETPPADYQRCDSDDLFLLLSALARCGAPRLSALYLEKRWNVLAEAPPEIAAKSLGDRVFPRLVNDWALRRRTDRPIINRPLGWLGDLVITLVVWLAIPLVIAAFWWRSMPAHLPCLTLVIAGALLLGLYVSLSGWRRGSRGVLAEAGLPPTKEQRRLWLRAVWRGAVTTIYLLSLGQ